MTKRRAMAVLLMTCLSLTGCLYYPITAPAVDTSAVSSPYPMTEIALDGDALRIHLNDSSLKDADFKRIKVVDAVLTTEAGKQIDLKLLSADYGGGVTFAFKLNACNGHFGLRVTTSLDDRTTTITGKLWIHDVGKSISWQELDHG